MSLSRFIFCNFSHPNVYGKPIPLRYFLYLLYLHFLFSILLFVPFSLSIFSVFYPLLFCFLSASFFFFLLSVLFAFFFLSFIYFPLRSVFCFLSSCPPFSSYMLLSSFSAPLSFLCSIKQALTVDLHLH